MATVVIWPDGTWCNVMQLHEYGWKSDDYMIKSVPEHLETEEQVEEWVLECAEDPLVRSDSVAIRKQHEFNRRKDFENKKKRYSKRNSKRPRR